MTEEETKADAMEEEMGAAAAADADHDRVIIRIDMYNFINYFY
jgi:hypothetical protein